MKRRRYQWDQVAAMARKANGTWRLHACLVAVTPDLLQHARRRVRALRPTETHVYEFARGASGQDDLGREVFDCYVRFVPKGTDP